MPWLSRISARVDPAHLIKLTLIHGLQHVLLVFGVTYHVEELLLFEVINEGMLVCLLLTRFVKTLPATVNEGVQELGGQALVRATILLLVKKHLLVFDVNLLLPLPGELFVETLALLHHLENLLKTVGRIGE